MAARNYTNTTRKSHIFAKRINGNIPLSVEEFGVNQASLVPRFQKLYLRVPNPVEWGPI